MAAVTVPTTEIGYTLAPNSNWWLYENETTPELVWPQSIYVYDQMRRQDSQIYSVLRAVTETLLRTPWRIDPAGARPRVVKFVADDLGLPIVGKNPAPPPRLKDRFSWTSHLREALLMLPFGHSFFEQVYRVNEDGTQAHLRKLAYRPAKTIERIDVAPDGGLVAIKQYWTSTNTDPKPIPVNHLVAYIHAREGGNWLGTSILRPAYKNWLLKDRLLRVQTQTIERNGMGVPLYKDAPDGTPESMAAGLAMAKAWRAGEAAGSAVPHEADLLLRGVDGTLSDAQPAIDYHDSQIARAVLAHFLNLGTQTGSWALGTTFADFFTMSLQTLAEQIRDTATQHIVEDLVDINFGENEPAPRLVFDEIGSRQAATAEALKSLVDAGIVHPDQVLEETSRQQYGLPPADPATATAPPQPAVPTAIPEPPTPTGALSVAAKFNPAEPREPHSGKWVGHGGGPAREAKKLVDGLRLGDKADLAPGETLLASGKVVADNGTVRLALVDGNGGRRLRIGIGDAAFGGRDDEAGPWRAGPDRTAALNIERRKLRDEQDRVGAELDRLDADPHADQGHKAALQKRLDELDDIPTADVVPSGYTANVDQPTAAKLQKTLSVALDAAAAKQQKADASFEEIDRLEAQRDKLRGMSRKWTAAEDARWDALTAQIEDLQAKANGPEFGYTIFAEGSIHGEWADVHYTVDLDDYAIGPQMRLAAVPPGSTLEDLDSEQQATFDLAEARRLVRLLGQYGTDTVQAAAGVDTHPGGEQLKHYWVYGEGAAKWSTWTELYHHLVKYLNPEMAKRTAAEWFHLRYGFWPGADVNRVKHGKPPRGHVVGPG